MIIGAGEVVYVAPVIINGKGANLHFFSHLLLRHLMKRRVPVEFQTRAGAHVKRGGHRCCGYFDEQ